MASQFGWWYAAHFYCIYLLAKRITHFGLLFLKGIAFILPRLDCIETYAKPNQRYYFIVVIMYDSQHIDQHMFQSTSEPAISPHLSTKTVTISILMMNRHGLISQQLMDMDFSASCSWVTRSRPDMLLLREMDL